MILWLEIDKNKCSSWCTLVENMNFRDIGGNGKKPKFLETISQIY